MYDRNQFSGEIENFKASIAQYTKRVQDSAAKISALKEHLATMEEYHEGLLALRDLRKMQLAAIEDEITCQRVANPDAIKNKISDLIKMMKQS